MKNKENMSKLILGTMRIGNLNTFELEDLIKKALKLGINTLDLADIYGRNNEKTSEEQVGEVFLRNPSLRKELIIQTKCGICRGYFDLSKEHIINSVNESLKKLNTSYIDILLLHRTDALMDVKEVNEAFETLYQEKKVLSFGVSNMNSMQISYLQKNLSVKIKYNQLQFSLIHSFLIDQGFYVNMKDSNNQAYWSSYSESFIDYARENDITIQAWSPLMASWEDGSFIDNNKYSKTNEVLERLANKYQVTKNAIAIAWITRIPANILVVLGTTSIIHLNEIAKENSVNLSRQEWYELYLSSGKILP